MALTHKADECAGEDHKRSSLMRLRALRLVRRHSRSEKTVEDAADHTRNTHHVVIDSGGLQYCCADDAHASTIASVSTAFISVLTQPSSTFGQVCPRRRYSSRLQPCSRFDLRSELLLQKLQVHAILTYGYHEAL
jgi:hypothetical protein